ncbi:MAG: helix-turn-helix domain-containing protein [Chloroflexi bacterium]|nr:helix-turn-helix domain-containing protein [Chloroflexota bacterium]
MSDLAQKLRETRDRLGISMEEAERATKIRRRYIEAIEAGDFGRLPDGPPARGFIKNYARYLGLDSDQSLSDFEAEVGVPITQLTEVIPPPPEHQQAISRYTQLVKLPPGTVRNNTPAPDGQQGSADGNGSTPGTDVEVNNQGQVVLRRPEAQPLSNSFNLRTPDVTQASDVRPFQTGKSPLSLRGFSGALSADSGPSRGFSSMSMNDSGRPYALMGIAAIGLLVIVALLALVILPGLQGNANVAAAPTATQAIVVSILGEQQQTTPVPATNPTSTAGIAVAIVGATQPVSVTTPLPAEPTAAAVAAQPTVPPFTGDGIQLVLDAHEHAWVRVTVDGAVVFEGIPPIGPNSSWRGQKTAGIETANAGAFDVIVNNTRLGPAGAYNATVKLTWDARGQVVNNP